MNRIKEMITSKMYKYIGLIFFLIFILVLLFYYFEKELSYEEIDSNMPKVRIYDDYLEISGSVDIDSIYITRAVYELKGEKLLIKLKGFNVPISKMEGEYNFRLNVNRSLYKSVEFLGINEGERTILFQK